MTELRIYPDGEAVAKAAVELVATESVSAIQHHGRFNWCLSGGTTPKRCYELLASARWEQKVDWPHVHVFWGDERCVPPESQESNYRMAQDALLNKVDIPDANVHRIKGELDPVTAAEEYSELLHRELKPGQGFDLVFLGLGPDGHTASLFPGLKAVQEISKWVVAEYVPQMEMWRITLTPHVFNASKNIAFLVEGAEKASILAEVLNPENDPPELPARFIRPTNGELLWLVDQAAAAMLQVTS